MTSPHFDQGFQDQLDELFIWRRDVRRFLSDDLPPGELDLLLEKATLAPSVGNSQPWRFVKVQSPEKRTQVRDHFETMNKEALADYHGEQARLYAGLKLSGLDQAPAHVAVYCDTQTEVGKGLGQKTMPETLKYSVVSAIQTLWLSARARGVGLGWVSILDPHKIDEILGLQDKGWDLIAYLCIGYPEEEHTDPELVRHGWQDRLPLDQLIIKV